MELTRWKKNWEELGQQDPMWAILSAPSKKNRKWDPEAFFQSGEAEIGHILNDVTAAGFPLRRETANAAPAENPGADWDSAMFGYREWKSLSLFYASATRR